MLSQTQHRIFCLQKLPFDGLVIACDKKLLFSNLVQKTIFSEKANFKFVLMFVFHKLLLLVLSLKRDCHSLANFTCKTFS